MIRGGDWIVGNLDSVLVYFCLFVLDENVRCVRRLLVTCIPTIYKLSPTNIISIQNTYDTTFLILTAIKYISRRIDLLHMHYYHLLTLCRVQQKCFVKWMVIKISWRIYLYHIILIINICVIRTENKYIRLKINKLTAWLGFLCNSKCCKILVYITYHAMLSLLTSCRWIIYDAV